jgi:hypothetical protein
MKRGAVYVAYGEAARSEAAASIKSLKRHNDFPVCVIGQPVEGADCGISFDEPGPGARWAKLRANLLTPYTETLYLDADTRIRGDLRAGFEMLADGWDVVMAPSGRQGRDKLGHLSQDDRDYTLEALSNPEPLNLQAGLMFFSQSKQVSRLFEVWRQEWKHFREQDQGALLRALAQAPVRVWMLGAAWNSAAGELVEHRFGRAKQ